MNKLFTKIAALSAGLAMAIGVGVALGQKGVVEAKADDGTWTLAGPSTNGTVVGDDYDTGVGGINFTGAQGGNGSDTTVPKWYSSGGEIRVYSSNDITFSISSGNITSISFTYSGDTYKNLESADVGTLSSGAWSGEASSVTFRNGSSQTRFTKVMFEYSTGGSSKTLESIAVTGSMSKTSYTTAESWDPSGLVVTATYDDTSEEIVTNKQSLSWSYNPATPAVGVTSVVATASYGGKSASSAAQAVTITEPPADPGTESNPYTVCRRTRREASVWQMASP